LIINDLSLKKDINTQFSAMSTESYCTDPRIRHWSIW